ncbi:MAG: hypothetical protein M9954_13780 [Cyclobacteriaceae bacterium]|nr:hypothetical protein [Flammeovirgaceae bacterium]MCO5272723.1 hypothetical protein [Cyclobacteriaceae bacterium]
MVKFDSVIRIKKPGYIYVYLTYENESNNYVYFDDLKVTYTKSQVVQSNNYYAFGLQTKDSWTRIDTKPNQYLYNSGSELNKVTGNYEMFFRGYDPAIGRMSGVEIMASKYASYSPYNYSINDPVYYNDPSGAEYEWASMGGCGCWRDEGPQDSGSNGGGMYGSSWFSKTYGGGFVKYGVGPNFGPDYYADAQAVKDGKMSLEDYGKMHGTTYTYQNKKYTDIDYTTEYLNGELWTGATVIIGNRLVLTQQIQGSGPGDLSSTNSNKGPDWFSTLGAVDNIFAGATSISLHQLTNGGKLVPIASKGAYVGAKAFGNTLGAAGLAVTGYQIYDQGLNTSNTLDAAFGAVAFIPGFGWAVSGTYFVSNLVTIGITGQSIGEHLQGAVTGNANSSWKPWGN